MPRRHAARAPAEAWVSVSLLAAFVTVAVALRAGAPFAVDAYRVVAEARLALGGGPAPVVARLVAVTVLATGLEPVVAARVAAAVLVAVATVGVFLAVAPLHPAGGLVAALLMAAAPRAVSATTGPVPLLLDVALAAATARGALSLARGRRAGAAVALVAGGALVARHVPAPPVPALGLAVAAVAAGVGTAALVRLLARKAHAYGWPAGRAAWVPAVALLAVAMVPVGAGLGPWADPEAGDPAAAYDGALATFEDDPRAVVVAPDDDARAVLRALAPDPHRVVAHAHEAPVEGAHLYYVPSGSATNHAPATR